MADLDRGMVASAAVGDSWECESADPASRGLEVLPNLSSPRIVGATELVSSLRPGMECIGGIPPLPCSSTVPIVACHHHAAHPRHSGTLPRCLLSAINSGSATRDGSKRLEKCQWSPIRASFNERTCSGRRDTATQPAVSHLRGPMVPKSRSMRLRQRSVTLPSRWWKTGFRPWDGPVQCPWSVGNCKGFDATWLNPELSFFACNRTRTNTPRSVTMGG
jgi:hypothetical protein